MKLELRVLRYFLAVAREQSVTGAAEVLNVTQPTLSRQLIELEESLGKKLFLRLRGSRKITLTEEGRFLQKRAQEILDLANKTEDDLSATDELINGEVMIGAGETDAMRLIAQTIKMMCIDYPNIRYQLFSGNAEDVTERLDKGLLDFGILIGNVDVSKYDCLRLAAVDTWGLYMRKDSELASLSSISPKVLRNIPLICSRQALIHNELSGWLGSDFDRLNVVATYNLIYNAALMVDEGVGYALSLAKLVNMTGDSDLCFRPLKPRFESQLNLVWKKQQAFSKAAEVFLEKIHGEISFGDKKQKKGA
jgi:DNA-binding transcriptional LysR family regulator